MPVRAIVGAQWGDEGKGKITDVLAQNADLVVRYGGGSNAGHTVVNALGEFKLHAVPSGIFNARAISLIGTGCVVDFEALSTELRELAEAGIGREQLRISSRAHVVMPYHLLLDRLQDEARGSSTIGTTRRGVGPTYVDKADRVGLQAGDLLYPETVRAKLELVLPLKNRLLREVYDQPALLLDDLLRSAEAWRVEFGEIIVDQVPLIAEALSDGRMVLLEGQLGALRDLDWGTYPYVTSSATLAGGGAVGGGIPPRHINSVVGVVKAYTSAVGTGPVPTELLDDDGVFLREEGAEYGATTGRPRRVGWFDAVATRYAGLLNGFSAVAVTKLDVLDKLERIKVCVAYREGDRRYTTLPATAVLQRVVPEYEELPGWQQSTGQARSWNDLPPNAQAYIRRLEELVDAPVRMISVGPARDQTISLGQLE